ncbi:MAG: hypothetical protein IJL26_02345 [Clostridia bacterium]|nr:hypothetical protein [Clostridia bacterium]
MAVFHNQATLTYSGGTASSNITTGELLDALTVSKNAAAPSYTPGGAVTYSIGLVNGGTVPLADVSVSDDLGGYPFDGGTVYPLAYTADSLLYYVNGVLQPTAGLTVNPGAPLTIEGISIPAGGNALLVYGTTATAFAPLGEGAQITNTATVTGGGTTQTAAATVPAQSVPELSIEKAISPQTVSGSEPLTYTFTIRNAGGAPAAAEDAVVLSDTFDPVLAGLAVSFGDTPATLTTDYTYDEATGVFATVAGAITVPAATFAQAESGEWTVTPGVTVVTVSGTV